MKRINPKFKKTDYDGNVIIIKGQEYFLCACVNCGDVHACISDNSLVTVDTTIECCNNPDNWCLPNGAEKIIDKFIKKWE